MNIYALAWLQFLFPFYVWFLIGLIIVVSCHSSKLSRSLGKNPIAALATLILLSYSKLLRTMIAVLSSRSLEYPDGSHKLVWIYDGNVPYFLRIDHILLGVFSVFVLLLLFLLTHFFCCVVTGFRLTQIGGYLSGSIASNHSCLSCSL